jgi:hypothetical protein
VKETWQKTALELDRIFTLLDAKIIADGLVVT